MNEVDQKVPPFTPRASRERRAIPPPMSQDLVHQARHTDVPAIARLIRVQMAYDILMWELLKGIQKDGDPRSAESGQHVPVWVVDAMTKAAGELG